MSHQAFGSRRQGFTLIELLTVIAIIGILAAIIIPVVGNVQLRAQQQAAASNLRQIALGYVTFATGSGRARTIPATVTTIDAWAAYLAERVDLTTADLYLIPSDPALATVERVPRVIGTTENNTFTVDPLWATTPIAYAAFSALSANAPTSTTPLIWTRGLQDDGNWDPTINPWETNGGHIAYLDGHVVRYDDLGSGSEDGALVTYGAGTLTNNIEEAASPNAVEAVNNFTNAGGGS
ncbi:MAG: type II secretion system protein [Opitutales bacterium]